MRKKKTKSRARVCLFVPICAVAIIAIFTAVGNYWVQIFEKYQEKEALEEKCDSIESILSVPSYRIVPCSAHTGYGIEKLVGCIEDQLEFCVYDKD